MALIEIYGQVVTSSQHNYTYAQCSPASVGLTLPYPKLARSQALENQEQLKKKTNNKTY